MHRRLVEPALRALDEAGAVYFYDLVGRVERDPRTSEVGNLVFLTLRESIPVLPPLIDAGIVIDELFKFIAEHRVALEHRIHSPRFVLDPEYLRPMVLIFVKTVSDLIWERVEAGEISADGEAVWRMNWPYTEDPEFPYQSLEDQEAEDAVEDSPEDSATQLLQQLTNLVGGKRWDS